jgi:hypothetical protein
LEWLFAPSGMPSACLTAPWATEYTTPRTISVASVPVSGPLIAVFAGFNKLRAKQGSLTAPWTTEYNNVDVNAVIPVSVAG